MHVHEHSGVCWQVFDIMTARGFTPTATTYTALISAHAKADRLDHALATFQRMVCLRSPFMGWTLEF